MEGHLATPRRMALPAFAALGGMVLPAAMYASLNGTDPVAIRGWAIPTATDIVLALGVLSLLGPRVPTGLKVFLTALAIFDDIGAVLVIALFLGEAISLVPLAVAGLAVAGLVFLNHFRITRSAAYVVLGVVLWLAMLEAGLEPALAGVVIAFAIPLHRRRELGSSPLRELERRLHPWGILFVVPVFAFFNAGIVVDTEIFTSLLSDPSLGIVGGLFLGKQAGVAGTAWLTVRLGLGQLPPGVKWGQIYGVALLAGIGFTLSLFVVSLAFAPGTAIGSAKIAVLVGSSMSAVAGLAVVYLATQKSRPAQS